MATPQQTPTVSQIFFAALRLGCTSFGGPVAHLAYFRREYVERRQWIDEPRYAELVALCQFLPGPASSQTGFGLGYQWRGWAGGMAAWLGFTLPSALLMTGFALSAGQLSAWLGTGWLHGLKLAAVAVVAQAVLAMWLTLAPDWARSALVVMSTAVLLLYPAPWLQIVVIGVGALGGYCFLKENRAATCAQKMTPTARPGLRTVLLPLGAFVLLLMLLPLGRSEPMLALADKCYRAGALVFGGGHVVLPLLEKEFVASGNLSAEQFLAGYGAAQAMPGPLFSFATYLGATTRGIPGAAWATLWVFLPGLLLVAAALPVWHRLRASREAQGAIRGANAAVVGLLLATLIRPIGTASLTGPTTIAIAACAFIFLQLPRIPVWLVVLACGAVGGLSGAS